jgi:toxin ParE1/3/4
MAFYKLKPEAEEDLNRIWRRGVRDHGEAQADRYYYGFIKRFEQLAEEPYLYPAVDDVRHGYRRSVCGVDNVYYRVVHDGVEIMRIVGQQDIDEWL